MEINVKNEANNEYLSDKSTFVIRRAGYCEKNPKNN